MLQGGSSRAICLRSALEPAKFGSRITQRFASSGINERAPPEHPHYIDVPQLPRHRSDSHKPRVRGTLPVPRRVFRRGTQEELERKLGSDVVKPHKEITATGEDGARLKYRQEDKDLRLQNLREGLEVLRERRQRFREKDAKDLVEKSKRAHIRIFAPDPAHVKYTNPSIIAAVKAIGKGPLPDPNREERIAKRAADIARRTGKDVAKRRMALHELYMNARTFMVTEEDFLTRLNETFDDPYWKVNPDASIWDREGVPENLQQQVELMSTIGSMTAVANANASSDLTKKRLKRVAEELTGGKFDD